MVLMQVNHAISGMPGVIRAGILMASEMNKKLMAAIGFAGESIDAAQAGDMMIGIEAESRECLDNAMNALNERLAERKGARSASRSRHFGSLPAARRARPDANLAVISIPGPYVAREAHKALDAGLHCFLFSDNVSRDDELALKKRAAELDLLVMGPDCGTAIIDGTALGFANRVPRGSVGVIGASGTGIQEFTVLLDRLAGQGVTQAIGLGGRDLSPEIGGLGALKSFRLLAGDPATECIAFISKPPSPEVVKVVRDAARKTGKPVVFCLLEPERKKGGQSEGVPVVYSLEAAAVKVLEIIGVKPKPGMLPPPEEFHRIGRKRAAKLRPEQKSVCGVFSGGSLCLEVMAYLVPRLDRCYSNIGMPGALSVEEFTGSGNRFWDMGEDEFTQGRVHPMIDPGLAADYIVREAERPDVAAVMLDIVIGYGANPDPAAIFAAAVEKARDAAAKQNRTVHFLAHVCGTEGDPQKLSEQERRMTEAGAHVCDTNLQMAKIAAAIVAGSE